MQFSGNPLGGPPPSQTGSIMQFQIEQIPVAGPAALDGPLGSGFFDDDAMDVAPAVMEQDISSVPISQSEPASVSIDADIDGLPQLLAHRQTPEHIGGDFQPPGSHQHQMSNPEDDYDEDVLEEQDLQQDEYEARMQASVDAPTNGISSMDAGAHRMDTQSLSMENSQMIQHASHADSSFQTFLENVGKEDMRTYSKPDFPDPLPPMASPEDAPVADFVYIAQSLGDLSEYINQNISVKVLAKYLTTRNKEIVTRQIWGTDMYTDDSDVVAMLIHTGQVVLRSSIPSNVSHLNALLRVREPASFYAGSTRHRFKSRSWASAYHRTSLEVLSVTVEWNNDDAGVAPGKTKGPVGARKGKRRFAPDTTIVYNKANEPCLKYCLGLMFDRGLDKSKWTSTRLKREVMYFESLSDRFELSREPQSRIEFDSYRWARVKPGALFGKPRYGRCSDDSIEVVQCALDWDEFEWGPSSVVVRGTQFELLSVQFLPLHANDEEME